MYGICYAAVQTLHYPFFNFMENGQLIFSSIFIFVFQCNAGNHLFHIQLQVWCYFTDCYQPLYTDTESQVIPVYHYIVS